MSFLSRTPESIRRRAFFVPTFEPLEQREVPATAAAVGSKLASVLNAYAASAVVAPALGSVPTSVQKSILSDAADDVEARLDQTLRRGSALAADLGRTGAVPKMDAGYSIDLNPRGRPAGWVGRIAFDRPHDYSDRVAVADGRSGFDHLDRQFGGDLRGTADVRGVIGVKWGVDLYEDAQGRLAARLLDGGSAELANVRANTSVAGRGGYAALTDVSLAGRGAVTGRAAFRLVELPNGGLRSVGNFDLPATLDTVVTSNDTFSKGVTWSVRDATRLTGDNDLRRSIPQFTAPQAVDLLRATLRAINNYRVNLPDGMAAAIQSALNTKVPFTSKTIGEVIGFPNFVPLAVNAINPNAYRTFADLAAAVNKDKRFAVLLAGDAGAMRFAQGQLTDILSVRVKANASKSWDLAQGPSGTYSPYPGITLEGKSKLYVELKAAVDGLLKLDTRGLGVREGTSAKLEVKLGGELSGTLSVLEIGKLFSLFSANVKAGAYAAGVVTATLGRVVDKDGNPTGSGVLYIGAAAKFNPPRKASDFVRVDADLKAGVEVGAKVKVLGITVWKKEWNKDWTLVRSTRLPLAPLS